MEHIIRLTGDTLFKIDSKGKMRTWFMEIGEEHTDHDNASYRTISGLEEGEKVISKWKVAKPKNVGRANETTAYEQAMSEVKSLYTKRQDRGANFDRSRAGERGKFFPMLAESYKKRKKDIVWSDGWFAQPKLDGIRCVATVDGLHTREGKPIPSCQHIWYTLYELFVENPDLVLDGELYNHELRDDFNKITSLVRKQSPNKEQLTEIEDMVQYHIYDCEILGNDGAVRTFLQRNAVLTDLFFQFDTHGYIELVDTRYVKDEDHFDDLFSEFMEAGYEGSMARKADSLYEEDHRSKYLLKCKEFITEEFMVDSMVEGQGNWSGCVKRFTLHLGDGRTFGAGVRGKQPVMQELFESNKTPDWVTLRYFNLTPDGIPRFPVVVDWGFGERKD